MKRNKITLAVLIVLFVCQFAFASTFQSADKAGTAAVFEHAVACDVLENMAISQRDPFSFFKAMALASDNQIEQIFAAYGVGQGFDPATSAEDLAELFPFGIEETSFANAFRRTALQLAWYYGKNGKTLANNAALASAQVAFNIVGYDFAITLDGDKVSFGFVDVYAKSQIPQIAKALMQVIPGAVGYEYPTFGKIVIDTNGLSEFMFHSFVGAAKGLVYNTLF